MHWMQLEVAFESPEPLAVQDMIGYVFRDLGITGVVIQEPGQTGMVIDKSPTDTTVCDRYSVTGYVAVTRGTEWENLRIDLTNRLDTLEAYLDFSWNLVSSFREEEEWAHAWKAFFHPVHVTDRLVVAPSWEEYIASDNEIVIRIDPGMAFGTGTHPTTCLCMELIEKYARPQDALLDIGTGSGILMITAGLLGGKKLFGCDNDPVACKVAEENLVRNSIPRECFTIWRSDLTHAVYGGPYPFVVANITAEPICRLIPELPLVLDNDGVFVASGIVVEKVEMVRKTLSTHGFQIVEEKEIEGWIGLCARYVARSDS